MLPFCWIWIDPAKVVIFTVFFLMTRISKLPSNRNSPTLEQRKSDLPSWSSNRKLLCKSGLVSPFRWHLIHILDRFNFQWRESSLVLFWNGICIKSQFSWIWLPILMQHLPEKQSVTLHGLWQPEPGKCPDTFRLCVQHPASTPGDINKFSIFSPVCIIPWEGLN